MTDNEKNILIKVRNLRHWFPVKKWFFEKPAFVKAVDDVSFDVYKGETLGVAGESGCGKSTLIRVLLRIIGPTAGLIEYDGIEISGMKNRDLRPFRKNMQIVFQDPYSSLDSRWKVGKIIEEPLVINRLYRTGAERKDRVRQLMELVRLNPSYVDRYPHEFSGGQRQRIVIARALATSPKLLMCDEAVSSLDVSVRAQILNLLESLQDKLELTYMFISHDLSVIEHICDRVAIMYLGKIVEIGSKDDIFNDPRHPYTKALLSAVPTIDDNTQRVRILLQGDIPSPVNPPEGCRFRTRCQYVSEICRVDPETTDMGNGHLVSCHRCS